MKISVVDLFCGAGGTSTGLDIACAKRNIHLNLTAINHWTRAINTHSVNHPKARHLCEPIEMLKPREVVKGKLHILVASPECTHHSNARGGKPINDQSRSTAFRVVEWTEVLCPDWVLIENVPEFQTWGPTGEDGRPIKAKKGAIFGQYIEMFRAIGYTVDFRVLNAADYGDPTTRRRLFIIARRGNEPVPWPEPSHCDPKKLAANRMLSEHLKPWKSARDHVIDFSIDSQSIFSRKKPLARKTLERILAGAQRFGWWEPFLVVLRQHMDGKPIDGPVPSIAASGQHVGLAEPIVIRYHKGLAKSTSEPMPTQTGTECFAVAEPFLLPHRKFQIDGADDIDCPMRTIDATNGRRNGVVEPFVVPVTHQGERPSHSIDSPVPTVTTAKRGELAMVEAFLVPNFGERDGQDPRTHSAEDPLPTVTATGHQQVVEPMLVQYNGTSDAKTISEPLGVISTKDRFALATPIIVETPEGTFGLDIRLRMLSPRELASAMSFPADYEFLGNKEEQVRQIGNAVPVGVAEDLLGEILDTYREAEVIDICEAVAS